MLCPQEQVAALQASLRESGDRFAFLQSLAQQQQQQNRYEAAAVDSKGFSLSAAAEDDKLSWADLAAPVTQDAGSSDRTVTGDKGLEVLLRMRPLNQLQQIHQAEEDFEVPTEEQELEDVEASSERQQTEQPIALQPEGLARSKDTMHFDQYFSPQSASAAEGSPSTAIAETAVAAVVNNGPAEEAATKSSGIARSLGLGPFRFFGRSGALSRLYGTTPISKAAVSPAVPPVAAAVAAAGTYAFGCKSPVDG